MELKMEKEYITEYTLNKDGSLTAKSVRTSTFAEPKKPKALTITELKKNIGEDAYKELCNKWRDQERKKWEKEEKERKRRERNFFISN